MPGGFQAYIDPRGIADAWNSLTGNSPAQKRERFIQQELPQLAQKFLDTRPPDGPDDPEAYKRHMLNSMDFLQRAHAAGFTMEQSGQLLNQLLPAARAKTAAHVYDEIENARKERAGKISEATITGQPSMVGAEDQQNAFRRQGDFSQDDALRLGRLEATTGAKIPTALAPTLRVPSEVEQNYAQTRAADATARLRQTQQSREQVESNLAKQQYDELEGLGRHNGPSDEAVDAGVVGRATRGRGLTGYLNMIEERPVRQSQAARNRAAADLSRARQGAVGRESGTVTETTTEAAQNPLTQLQAQRTIAALARDRGVTNSEGLKQIASELGYELTGSPALTTVKKDVPASSGFLGMGASPAHQEDLIAVDRSGNPLPPTYTLGGNFTLRRRPTTRRTTRGASEPGERRAPATSKEEILRRYGLD